MRIFIGCALVLLVGCVPDSETVLRYHLHEIGVPRDQARCFADRADGALTYLAIRELAFLGNDWSERGQAGTLDAFASAAPNKALDEPARSVIHAAATDCQTAGQH